MAKLVELTQPDGKPVLVNADAVTLVQTPNEAMGYHRAANALVTVAGQVVAVTETVTQVKAKL